MGRSSVLRRRPVAVFLATLLATTFVPIGRPAPVEAALPPAAQCQAGFLAAAAPSNDAPCPSQAIEPAVSASLPSGFQESVVLSGLSNPTVIRFATDGRVFVAEKSGAIKIFDSLADPTPNTFTGLTTAVQNFWDRGLLGMALDPTIAGGPGGTGSYLYVLYAYDHILGDTTHPAPKWGDQCPSQPNGPGPTTDGCVISARLSRLAVTGSTITGGEQVLLEDWCQQFPSHSIGTLVFGPDGALYVSGGEGYLDVFQSGDANRFTRLARVPTAAGARTSLFVPELSRLFLAVPHRGGQRAEIRVYEAR